MTIIKSAGTASNGMSVNSEGQASVISESLTEARHVSSEGNVYIISSGFAATATVADDATNLLYVKNTSNTLFLHLGYLRTCNEVGGFWQWIDNPTALGTTAITPVNMKRGSTKPLAASVETFSSAGTTFTVGDRTDYPQWIQGGPAHSIQPFEGSMILSPGQSFGLEFAPFGTTAGVACVTLQVWTSDR